MGPRWGLLVLGHGWIMEVSKSNQTPTITGHTHDTTNDDAINTLLQSGLLEGIPLIAEMLANAAMRSPSSSLTPLTLK